ncbi:O-antigen ligase family protein [Bradyrhizobium sp. STM 3562]|uniref:O-antigen ligase family protein n=1 Tax=Bradyrhizobium sp. STM 3562 TaxID=578924 RepID=UPI0038901798
MERQSQLYPIAARLQAPGHWTAVKPRQSRAATRSGSETALKWLIAALFLPEGLSFFIGDFRLSVARVLIIVLTIRATAQYFQKFPRGTLVSSDLFALAAGLWMIIAATIVEGPVDGLKGGGIMALEFTGTYWIFRHHLGPLDGSVRLITFACKLTLVVVALAALDPLTDRLFCYEFAKAITGYSSPGYEWAKAVHADTMYRNGVVRAMGPLEHSILFGAVCAWFGTIALCTFPSRLLGWSVALAALAGIIISQARGPLMAYALSLTIVTFYYVTYRVHARWKVLGTLCLLATVLLFMSSSNPVATLLKLSGISNETGWYREAIWEAVTPLVLQSPFFGMGLKTAWDWQTAGLAGESVDAMWLRLAMVLGIPTALLVLFTMIGTYFGGSLDRSPYLSREEGRLSVALGIVTFAAVFLGFTVHFWGTCWNLLGIFAGIRASLVEARACRHKSS